jgi:predicted DNA-binding protein (MmcQ/YjbR family)
VLVESDPARYFVPPYVGHHGWVGVYLEGGLDWGLIADLVEDSYRMTAPKRLCALLDAR